MEGELFHLVDREVLLNRVKSLDFNSPERVFLLGIMDNTIRVHKEQHNYNIEAVIELCREGKDTVVTLLQKCRI